MAEVITSPKLELAGRRLPIGKRDVEDVAEQSIEHTPERFDAGYVAQLMAERDTALQRAEQAESALQEHRADIASLRQEAESIGYQAGLEKAEEEAKASQAARNDELKLLLQNLRDEQPKLIRLAEEAAVEIGFSSAVKLLGRMKTDPTLLQSLVQQALNQVVDREGLVVWLSPTDCQRMQQLVRANIREWQGIEFKGDDQIELGGCRIDSRCGSLDARLELQMNALKELLVHTNNRSGAGVS